MPGKGEGDCEPNAKIEKLEIEAPALKNLSQFELKEILRIDSERKSAFLYASHSANGDSAVLILEKKAFQKENMEKFLEASDKMWMNRLTQNSVFGNYDFFPLHELNSVKCTVIHPATQKQIDRFREQGIRMVVETAELYNKITLPYITNDAPFSHEWVYNVLDGTKEQDRVIVRDEDAETGFVLAIDLKWDGVTVESLYLQAMVMRKDVKSIRDLTAAHLPLLRNIKKKSLEAINEKYGLEEDQVRAYFHYHPTYYHLHVHFVTVQWEAPAFGADRAHLLDNVIGNLEMFPDYYQKATITYGIKENDPLLAKIDASFYTCTELND